MEQVKELLSRFQVPGRVAERAMEYYRLAEVRCRGGVGGATSTGLALVCIEIACTQLGEPFDKRQAQKLSGMKPKPYVSVCQTVERLLNVTSQVNLRDLAVKFDCLEAVELAQDVEENYKMHAEEKYTASQKEALDFSKPLYATAALYTACRLLKIRCDKNTFQNAAMCTRSVFQNVLDEMTECAPKDIDDFKRRKTRKQNSDVGPSEADGLEDQGTSSATAHPNPKRGQRESLHSRIQSNPFSSEYQEWREQILREAREKLKPTQTKNGRHTRTVMPKRCSVRVQRMETRKETPRRTRNTDTTHSDCSEVQDCVLTKF